MGKWLGILGMLALALTACGADAASASPIEYRRTGGIVGFDDHLVIDARGHATLTRRAGKIEFDLRADDLARLHAALRDAGFAALPTDSTRKPYLVPDELSYVVVYQGHTVKTSDTAIPPSLAPALELLAKIVDAQGH